MTSNKYDFCIVGAGAAGLTLAYKLTKAGKRVLMVERDARPGGLSKSYAYGEHKFDTGPKRFHTDDPIVLDFIHEIEDLDTIGRSTLVHFANRYFNWPLNSSELIKMPLGISIRVGLELLRRKGDMDRTLFRDYIRSQYGDTLYGLFFKPYTEKFLRWSADDLHSDWASTGINRTVIDKRIKANSLLDIVSALMLPQKVDTKFLYPKSGMFGSFVDHLYEHCLASGRCDILLSDTVTTLKENGDTFQAQTRSGREVSFETLVWSGNLNDLVRLISADTYNLRYLNTIFYNLVVREEAVGRHRAQWIYVSRGDSLISRITCPREFGPTTCPDGYYNVMCEITDSQSNPQYFDKAESLRDDVLSELVGMNFLKTKSLVEQVHVNAVRDTYPIYHLKYKQEFAGASRAAKRLSPRIHLLGRTGAYWYNNSDHSIRMALDFAVKLLTDPEKEFDFRSYFGGTVSKINQVTH